MKDLDGQILIPFRRHDLLRHSAVWAVYKFANGSPLGERQTEPAYLATAKGQSDLLNGKRDAAHYYRIHRIATEAEGIGGIPTGWR
jgi:hypothetical protein